MRAMDPVQETEVSSMNPIQKEEREWVTPIQKSQPHPLEEEKSEAPLPSQRLKKAKSSQDLMMVNEMVKENERPLDLTDKKAVLIVSDEKPASSTLAAAFMKGKLAKRLDNKTASKKPRKEKTKEELIALRKNMTKSKRTKANTRSIVEEIAPVDNFGSDDKAKGHLINRLISGKSHKVSKKEAKRLAS